MAVGSDYSSPVTVNGFSCRNCTDMAYAAKRIDPAHPKSGPDGIDAARDPSLSQAAKDKIEQAKAARAGHDLATQGYGAQGRATGGITPGRLIDGRA